MMGPFEATMRMIMNGGPPEDVAKTYFDVAAGESLAIEAVSTIDTEEGFGYETALAEHGTWHPVERYETREDAVAGHARWAAAAPSLTEFVDIGLPSFDSVPTIVRFSEE